MGSRQNYPICPAIEHTQFQFHPYAQPQTIPSPKFTPYAQPKNVPSPTFSSHMDRRRTSSVLPFHSTWPAEEHTHSHISSHMASRRTSLSHCSRCHAHKITVHLHHDVDVHPHHLHVQYPALRPTGCPPCSPPPFNHFG